MFLHNTMQRPYYFPAWMDGENEKAPQTLIDPGQSVEVSDDHFTAVLSAGGKGNRPLQALLDERFLVAGDQPGDSRIQLSNPTIEAPADLVEEDPAIKRQAKVETATVELNTDEPRETKRGRK